VSRRSCLAVCLDMNSEANPFTDALATLSYRTMLSYFRPLASMPGNLRMTVIPIRPRPVIAMLASVDGEANQIVRLRTTTTVTSACRRTLSRIPWCSCQSRRIGPRKRDRNSAAFNRGEDRARKKLASNRKGVVGNTGRMAPAAPSTTNTPDNTRNRIRRGPVTGFLGLSDKGLVTSFFNGVGFL